MHKPESPENSDDGKNRLAEIMRGIGIDFDEVGNFEHTVQGDFTLTRFLLRRKARGDSHESIDWINASIKRLCESYPYAKFTSIYGQEASYVGGEIKNIFRKNIRAKILKWPGDVIKVIEAGRRKCFRCG
jgi:hypothetical protein